MNPLFQALILIIISIIIYEYIIFINIQKDLISLKKQVIEIVTLINDQSTSDEIKETVIPKNAFKMFLTSVVLLVRVLLIGLIVGVIFYLSEKTTINILSELFTVQGLVISSVTIFLYHKGRTHLVN